MFSNPLSILLLIAKGIIVIESVHLFIKIFLPSTSKLKIDGSNDKTLQLLFLAAKIEYKPTLDPISQNTEPGIKLLIQFKVSGSFVAKVLALHKHTEFGVKNL
jgi:hypothetical protein